MSTSLNKIRNQGLQALLNRLGPVGMIRFLRQFETGHGDYTAEREKWLAEADLEALAEELQQRRDLNRKDEGN